MRDLKLGKDFIVTVHNDLVEARFTDSLTTNEQKILFAVLSNIEPPQFRKDDKGNRIIINKIKEIEPFRIPIKDFTQWLGISDPNYAAFKKTVKRLMKKLIEIQQPDGSWEVFQWVTKASYIANTGTAEIKLSPELYPYLINLEKNFTQTKLNILLSFKSHYSTRLYQLIKKWSKIGTWKVELEELKMLLGIPLVSEKNGVKVFKLDKYSHFKDRALKTALNEINEHTEFEVTIKEHKTVRKVTAISFDIVHKEKKQAVDVPEQPEKPNEGINEQKPSISAKTSNTYASDLLERYAYKDKSLFDKSTGKEIFVDDLERVQLIILNRKAKAHFNFSDNACYLLEKELIKIINHHEFPISHETEFIFSYVNTTTRKSNSLKNPEGFIVKKTKELTEKILAGEKASYRDLFDASGVKIEPLPKWWFKGEQSNREVMKEKTKTDDNMAIYRLLPHSTLTLVQAKGIHMMMSHNPNLKLDELPEHYNYAEYKRLAEKYNIYQLIERKESELEKEGIAV